MTDSAHEAEVEAWRAQRYAALRRDEGWLTLAGLAWLEPGANRVGSDPHSDVVLPSGPSSAGTVIVADGAVVVATGSFTHDGAAADGLRLTSDRDGEPTMLDLGHLRLCLIERAGKQAIRTWDTASARRRSFDGIDHWPVRRQWRLEGRFEATPGRSLRVPDVLGVVAEEPSPGDAAFEVGGVTHRLQGLAGGENGELWLVFGDLTNGEETYRGGRFLYTGPPGADGSLVIDFNRSYNPPCVFSPYATCPLPWAENRLPIRIEAGEREYRESVDLGR